MPGRKIPLVTGEIYHVFNRGIDRRPTFTSKKEYDRAQKAAWYYKYSSLSVPFSKYVQLSPTFQEQIMSKAIHSEKHIHILAHCLMPNHFHFLVKQTRENGISKFLSNLQNSCTRYFNLRHKRIGPLFLDQFKAVRIEDDEQLLHVMRYILINPTTSFVIKNVEELELYPWSSFREYLSAEYYLIDDDFILKMFKNREMFKKFVLDQVDYQRRLEAIKHLTFDD